VVRERNIVSKKKSVTQRLCKIQTTSWRNNRVRKFRRLGLIYLQNFGSLSYTKNVHQPHSNRHVKQEQPINHIYGEDDEEIGPGQRVHA
jgi:hypothetical protein